MCVSMYTSTGAYRGRKAALDHPELDLQEVVIQPTWLLGTNRVL